MSMEWRELPIQPTSKAVYLRTIRTADGLRVLGKCYAIRAILATKDERKACSPIRAWIRRLRGFALGASGI